jgi:hypothetical protein
MQANCISSFNDRVRLHDRRALPPAQNPALIATLDAKNRLRFGRFVMEFSF